MVAAILDKQWFFPRGFFNGGRCWVDCAVPAGMGAFIPMFQKKKVVLIKAM